MKTNDASRFYALSRRIILLVLFILLIPRFGRAESGSELAQKPKPRPRIGLVLEGGGALGFAHVGVLQVLEENHIPVDVVAGTSIGSIVGAGYASGLSVAEMEKALSETNWNDLFSERAQRSQLTYRLKSGRDRELYGDTKLAFKEGKFAVPAGLIIGQNILPLFQKLFGNLASPCDFDALPLPFRAVTADLETGKAYIPNRGNLAEVVRASMSVPGAFSPVEMDGHLLVDGGIVDNFPVDVARNLGADVIIGSILDDELAKRDNLHSLLEVSGQMISLLLQQNSDISRKTLTSKDVLVAVELKGFTAGDFDKAKDIMQKGREAAERMLDQLRRFAVSEADYREFQEKRTRKTPPPITIDFVRVKNSSELSDGRILKQLRTKAGDTFDQKKVEEDIQRIFGTGYYNSVRYDVIKEDGKTGLEVEADGKDWLHQYVRLGLSLEDDFEGDNAFRLGAAYRNYNVTTRGSYAEAQFEIGRNPRIGGELYQPFGEDSPYFISPSASFGRSTLTVSSNGDPLARYNRTEGQGSFILGRELGSAGETGFGMTRGSGKLDRDIGDPTLPEFDYDIGEAFARIDLDKLDTPDFPTRGYLARLRYTSSLDSLGASDNFDTINGTVTVPLTFGRNTFIWSEDFASTLADRPVERSFALGGFLDVSGYLPGALAASDYVQSRLIFFRRFSELENPLFSFGFFFGGSMELTDLQNDAPAIADHNGVFSGSVFLGADTPLLPTYLGYGRNDEQQDSFYLAIGRIGQARR